MNNNRGNNNRRRGRSSNRQQGGQQLNRIDSRARGNAQQMLDKYRKMAHDAHLNGDRVQEEYYLQFADHYFRVLADQKQRQDDTRPRRDDRPQENADRPRFEDSRGRDDYADFDYDGDEEQSRPAAESRPADNVPASDDGDDARGESDPEAAGEFEPAENPFVRESRPPRGRTRQPRPPQTMQRDQETDRVDEDRGMERGDRSEGGFDPSVLPPSIGASSDEQADDAPAKPRRRARKPRVADGPDEALEALG